MTDSNSAPSNISDRVHSSSNGASQAAAVTSKSAIALPPKATQSQSTEVIAQLNQLLSKRAGDRHLVLIQDFPDPDALSSAWAYRLICREFNIECDIYYGGTLSHQENIALVRLSGLPVRRWNPQSKAGPDLSKYQAYVLLDTQGTTTQLTHLVEESNLSLFLVVDHHAPQREIDATLLDLRPHIRATATILTQYLQSEKLLVLDRGNSSHVKCATALMHGLRSDTNNLMHAVEADFMAAAYLSNYYDPQLLAAILRASRSKRVMDVIERSLRNRTSQNNVSIAGVGYLRYDDRDAIPQAADFLVTEENIHTAVVYGIVHDEDEEREVVIGSLRTSKITLDPDEFIKEAFGQDAEGRFFGGGRTTAGGFEIPVGFLSGFYENGDYNRLKWEVFDMQIKQKLWRLINPDDDLISTD
ncbi:MAG: bifunctional oligoribonuclease/PAP phosphatase NrnA [Cyanobacteria bacterium P01_C01_bin.120]